MQKLLKNKMVLIYGGLVILLAVTGYVVYQTVFAPVPTQQAAGDAFPTPVILPPVDESVVVGLEQSAKANTVDLTAKGLAGKYTSVSYEFTYDSEGLIKGVNSGSTPIDVTGKSEFTREIYLGTCSRNVCTPDKGVTTVSVVMTFTGTTGDKSQFSKDFEL